MVEARTKKKEKRKKHRPYSWCTVGNERCLFFFFACSMCKSRAVLSSSIPSFQYVAYCLGLRDKHNRLIMATGNYKNVRTKDLVLAKQFSHTNASYGRGDALLFFSSSQPHLTNSAHPTPQKKTVFGGPRQILGAGGEGGDFLRAFSFWRSVARGGLLARVRGPLFPLAMVSKAFEFCF